MVSSQSLPMDIVKHVLSYCKNVVIRNGDIIFINKLDKNKFASATDCLIKKPFPQYDIFDSGNITISRVRLSKFLLSCHVNLYISNTQVGYYLSSRNEYIDRIYMELY